jgi:hypothetical protein
MDDPALSPDDVAVSERTVIGVQMIPSDEYAMVYPVMLFVLSRPAMLVIVDIVLPEVPPTINRPPTASQITRVISLPFLNIAAGDVFACDGIVDHVFPVASVE